MKTALVLLTSRTVSQVFDGVPAVVALPGGKQVYGVRVGWQSEDGTYGLVAVAPFVPPANTVAVGNALYVYDGTNCTETYNTQPAPAIVSAPTFLGRFTGPEQVALYKAANTAMSNGNASYMFWLTAANSRGFVDLADPATVSAKAAIVAAGIMTQARADAVFVT